MYNSLDPLLLNQFFNPLSMDTHHGHTLGQNGYGHIWPGLMAITNMAQSMVMMSIHGKRTKKSVLDIWLGSYAQNKYFLKFLPMLPKALGSKNNHFPIHCRLRQQLASKSCLDEKLVSSIFIHPCPPKDPLQAVQEHFCLREWFKKKKVKKSGPGPTSPLTPRPPPARSGPLF